VLFLRFAVALLLIFFTCSWQASVFEGRAIGRQSAAAQAHFFVLFAAAVRMYSLQCEPELQVNHRKA